MFDEPFTHGQTWVHALDPRLRLGTALFCSCALTLADSWPQVASGLVAAGVLLACSRPPLRPLLRRLGTVNLFLLFLWLTVPWTVAGTAAFHVGSLRFSWEGLHLLWLITLKANAITLIFIACVATLPVSRLGQALQALRVPTRLVFLLLFTYRGLFLMADEWQRLKTALRLHGFVAASNLHSYRTLGYLLGLTLVRSVDRAGRIHQAMLLRGFNGSFTSLADDTAFTRRDALFLALVATLFILSLLLT